MSNKFGADVEARFAKWIQEKLPGAKIIGREWAPGQWIKEPTSKGWPDFAVKMPDGSLKLYEVKRQGQDLQLNQHEMFSALAELCGVSVAVEVIGGGFLVEGYRPRK